MADLKQLVCSVLAFAMCAGTSACGSGTQGTEDSPVAPYAGTGAAGASGSGAGAGGAAAAASGGRAGATTSGRAGSSAAGAGAAGARAGAAGASAGSGAAGSAGTAGVSGAAGSAGMSAAGASAAGASGAAGGGGMAGSMAGAAGGAAEECAADTRMPSIVKLSGDLGTHDPSMIEADGKYYLFQTGRGLPTKTSTDMKSWRGGSPVFAQNPAWVAQRVSGATDLWAPDISFYNKQYHLYYSASTFGSMSSCIGHATRESMSTGSWMDRGPVICSNSNGSKDNWNAIDPNLVVDETGAAWLAFGSFWDGIQLIPLDENGARKGTEVTNIAQRQNNDRAIEAAYIVQRCGYFYLFASFDACCRGADSTYNIRVGRSKSVKGPYVDRAGTAMLKGGGTMLVQGDSTWKGPGHNAVVHTAAGWFNVYHAYAASNGASSLRISEMVWDADGWPKSAGP